MVFNHVKNVAVDNHKVPKEHLKMGLGAGLNFAVLKTGKISITLFGLCALAKRLSSAHSGPIGWRRRTKEWFQHESHFTPWEI